ncbi:bifunctional diguanylate cyclase/phosphodiesterase, partial [Sphaerothrix gracilis]|uniref:putative bifunctional diguanylate cyclase/phosphodiesterase n=1 Tax=Sphaerothrix gracilis TaxID=3151835 RepID=UPI0031FD04A0
VLRANDMLARLGGDEFTILVDNVHALPEAIGVAERINLALSKPFNLKGHEVSVGTSIGIALSTENNLSAEMLLRNADIAMYQAKREKQSYAIFNVNMHEQVVARLKLETDLQQALSRRELSLNYQPIVSLSTSQLIGFEALLRWHHPVYGTVAPDQFISIAEDNGLIVEIEQWVLSQACQQLKDWQLRFPSFADLTMSVNLSIQHLQESALPLQLDRILEQANLASHFLRLEITESTLMANAQVAEAVLNELSIRHIQLSVDDFGTGYSSLSYLHRFPLQTLKIDRSFVERLVTKDDSKAIVQSIVTLSHSLNMNVIAEGIETHAQLQQLIALGCELGQGYLFSKPLTASAAEAFITQQSAVTSLSSL